MIVLMTDATGGISLPNLILVMDVSRARLVTLS